MTALFDYYSQLPFTELIAVALSLTYVILATKGNNWCWPAAFISTAIYTVIFYDVALLMDSLLNAYYMAMAIYGWYSWQSARKSQQCLNYIDIEYNKSVVKVEHKQITLTIISWSWLLHAKYIATLTLISFVLGFFMANYTIAAFPYLDSATTVFAVFTTYLVTQKVLENWLYWLIIDFVSIYLYLEKSLEPTAALFAVYVVIALYGYLQWLAQYKSQLEPALEKLVEEG